LGPKNVGIGLPTYLALELPPVATRDVFTHVLDNLLSLDPVLKAKEVDQAHRTSALASENQRVFLFFLLSPAESAMHSLVLTRG